MNYAMTSFSYVNFAMKIFKIHHTSVIPEEKFLHPPRLENEVFGFTSVVDEIALQKYNYLHETTTGNTGKCIIFFGLRIFYFLHTYLLLRIQTERVYRIGKFLLR